MTPRLDLVPATLDSCVAEAQGRDALAAALGVEVPASWPPPVLEPDDIERLRRSLETDPTDLWTLHYVLLRGAQPADRRALVGVAGYVGPPSPDGVVEIGYAVAEEYYRRGYASEAVEALVARAFDDACVQVIAATTFPALVASIAVLTKAGFVYASDDPKTGIVRYERRRTT